MPESDPAPTRIASRPGFTLVELTLTVVIIGLVAAVGVPRYANSLARYHADAAARRVVADVQHAQAHAKTKSTQTIVRFLADYNRLEIIGVAALDRPGQTYATRLDDEPYRAQLTRADFEGAASLIFDGYGQPQAGGTITLQRGVHQRIIAVDADTGEAVIQ